MSKDAKNSPDEELPTDETVHQFKLFVAGASPHSVRAIGNMRSICEKYLTGRYRLEVVDVYKTPDASKLYQIIALPLLIRTYPLPERRLIGDLSDTEKVINALSLIA